MFLPFSKGRCPKDRGVYSQPTSNFQLQTSNIQRLTPNGYSEVSNISALIHAFLPFSKGRCPKDKGVYSQLTSNFQLQTSNIQRLTSITKRQISPPSLMRFSPFQRGDVRRTEGYISQPTSNVQLQTSNTYLSNITAPLKGLSRLLVMYSGTSNSSL
jgi:hypothetical protein